jgi:hypothetical protein
MGIRWVVAKKSPPPQINITRANIQKEDVLMACLRLMSSSGGASDA